MKLTLHKPRLSPHTPKGPKPVRVERLRGSQLIKRNRRMAMKAPLCVHCKAKGLTSVVKQWDHVIPLYAGGADHESNLQGLCEPCHVAKTNEDAKKYGTMPRAGG